MNEIDEITERIIMELAKEPVSPNYNDFKNKLGIGTKEMNERLALLQTHDVAMLKHTAASNTVEKLPKLGEVVHAGGLVKYLQQKQIKEQEEANRLLKSHELTELQLSKIKEELASEITKNQNEFYQKSITDLNNKLDEKARAIEKELKTTTIRKNKIQVAIIIASFILSILAFSKSMGWI
jgi:DNA-binding Lrp family transcriptional regulator